MSSAYRKSVEGATKVKLAPPKAKYIQHILSATTAGEAGVGEVFRTLSVRIRDSTWTITLKALIVVHCMIREGEPNVTLAYLSTSPRQFLSVDEYAEVQTQGRNIRHYSMYLMYRAKAFQKAKIDYVRNGQGRMRKLTVDKGLLRETEGVQEQIAALLKCDLVTEEPENDITLCALRLLVQDLLALFPVMNEGVINVLEHFFELSKPDAERALMIYKRFAIQTDLVVRYLTVAKRFADSTRLEIPKLEHAKLGLAASLEEYLKDGDFDTNRRQFLAEREAKRSGKPIPRDDASASSRPAKANAGATVTSDKSAPTYKKPAADLMDFFDSIEPPQPQVLQQQAFTNNAMATGYAPNNGIQQQPASFQQSMQTGYGQPSTNPFGQLQAQPTGAGFGGYGPQAYEQQQFQQQAPEQFPAPTGYGHQASNSQSNPFRQQGQISPQFPQGQFVPGTNGMAQPQGMMPQQTGTNPFMQQQQQQSQPQPMMPQQTGTNPFGQQQQPIPQSMPPQSTGYNPFGQPMQSPPPMMPQQTSSNPFGQQHQQQPYSQQQQQQQPPPLMPQATGTNPFARTAPAPTSNDSQAQPGFGALVSQATGSTNPFKNSAFVNQQTGQGWHTAPQATMGGLEQLPTMPVFPRPGQQQQQQQPQQAWFQ